ncbi:AAA domain-containing protein [Desulfuromusa kysingii]|uniref:AAA domain-containing protein n=1 Tax=Desulfuromusa kysingii TaxID=37625 RepID=A0A1H3YHV1_9BACT|nr:AAA family ATPase [Desulfuromusa kysingii]SEA11179.1 AAA domain-containing protein [Desulfuromusa kysingii]
MNDFGSGTVIEFFGAPGVGKSYLAKGLSSYFKANSVNVSDQSLAVGQMSRLHRLVYKNRIIIPMLVLKPRILWILLAFAFKAGVKTPAAFMRVLVNWLYIVALMQRELKHYGVVILDQGIVQALWSTVFRGRNVELNATAALIRSLLKACSAKQLVVVHLSLDREKHRVRLASRLHGCSPLDDGDCEKFQRGLLTAKSVGDVVSKLENGVENQLINNVYFENDDNANVSCLYGKLLNILSS